MPFCKGAYSSNAGLRMHPEMNTWLNRRDIPCRLPFFEIFPCEVVIFILAATSLDQFRGRVKRAIDAYGCFQDGRSLEPTGSVAATVISASEAVLNDGYGD